jgi:hypothetical protein
MGTRTATRRQQALASARERRRRLDRDRDEHDRRVEQATAATLLALESREEARRLLDEVTRAAAVELEALLGLGVSIERAAVLLDLDSTEVRRLARVGARRPMVERGELSACGGAASANSTGGGESGAGRAG